MTPETFQSTISTLLLFNCISHPGTPATSVGYTELSPSPTNLMYRTPCCCSASKKPFRIISVSIEEEEPFQFLKQVWFEVLLGCTQAAQNLLRTPMYKSLFVLRPNITPTPQRALYECLCVRLLQPASTITVIAGTPSWYLFSCIASSRSALPAACIDSSNNFHHQFAQY